MVLNGYGGTETDYVYLDGFPVAAIQPGAASISYLHTDRLGTPQLATNDATCKASNAQLFYGQ